MGLPPDLDSKPTHEWKQKDVFQFFQVNAKEWGLEPEHMELFGALDITGMDLSRWDIDLFENQGIPSAPAMRMFGLSQALFSLKPESTCI